ncbi:putative Pyridoxal phosphate dependent enzyme [Trypanosoma vivax]|uniref:Tryptophan synthase beta chain-like PALP domain-containing protein n=1 Tax=Trypanosoma vivax (strain Y486) TaxID=1055687 RepID=G0TZ11_TRYVY|nr:hypothetical protein TRVL_04086 [Trypanosoma vivax]KAH8613044.1 putative Pyridoxal phosphate dependent enzyme [Trypanosoma vivax]CCC49214.1 conserved hypothetical protein [Trypanosoma vivax Y486]
MNFQNVMAAHKATAGYVHKTPIITSNALQKLSNHEEVILKCENLQRTGCYNLRGVMYHVICSKQLDLGINHFVTHSTGNHGLALAHAAFSFDATGHVIVPQDTPSVVINSLKYYNGEVHRCGPSKEDRIRLIQKVMDDNNVSNRKSGTNSCVYVHAQDKAIIAGNGTAGMELMLQTDGRLDAVIVPASGGTLLAGVAVAVKVMKPNIAVFGAECVAATDPMYEFEHGSASPDVACEDTEPNGLGVAQTAAEKSVDTLRQERKNRVSEFSTPFSPLVAQCVESHVDGVLKVTEAQVRHAFRFVYERCKIVIDFDAATAVAALVARPEVLQRYRRIGILLTGGNVELEKIPHLARL